MSKESSSPIFIGPSEVGALPLGVAAAHFGPSEVRALPLGVVAAEPSVHYFLGIIFLSFLFRATYFSPRRGCPRVLKPCTEA